MSKTPSRGRLALALACGLACEVAACGGEVREEASEVAEASEGAEAGDASAPVSQLPERPGAARQGQAESGRAAVDALLAGPTPAALLAVLGQGHAVARELLGRHTLAYTAEFSLVPVEPARPAVDKPIQLEQKVVDTLELKWGAGPGEPVRFYLSQKTDKERGREVMVIDEQAYTRVLHRGWHVRPLDGDLHLRWLDEAQHSMHDAVELAAPALAVTAVEEGELVKVELGLADPSARTPADTSQPGRSWRGQVEITAIEGSLTLERATGLWQSGEVRVRYGLRDAEGRAHSGETHLTGTVTRTPDLQISPPEHVQPLPERVRYEAERRRLLDGLAGT